MAAIDYPSEILPLPLVAKASHMEGERILRTSIATGYDQVRKRFTRFPVNFDLQLLLDQGSSSYLHVWYVDTLDVGLSWFNMELPVGDGLLSIHECRFIDNPKYTLNGVHWKVQLKIEAIELQLI